MSVYFLFTYFRNNNTSKHAINCFEYFTENSNEINCRKIYFIFSVNKVFHITVITNESLCKSSATCTVKFCTNVTTDIFRMTLEFDCRSAYTVYRNCVFLNINTVCNPFYRISITQKAYGRNPGLKKAPLFGRKRTGGVVGGSANPSVRN